MKRELVIVMDFGGQYNQLVARRVRECNVYCEIYSYKTPLEKIKEMNPKGIILTGGPNSCYLEDSPTYSKELFELGIPVLGLCYGAQLMQHVLGGKVERADVREYGKSILLVDQPQSKILKGVPETSTVWMSHFDYISKIAPGFEITTHTKDCPVASCEDKEKDLYAIQFHPEVLHSEYGKTMLSNFVLDVCNCAGDWRMDSFVEEQIKAIKEKVGNGKVLCALSGGVDSSVAAVSLSKAISHHNVGGLPDHVDFKEIIEPLRDLFKDEVRKVGLELGIPEYLVFRQPFPGPGLGIRIIGEVTADKVRIVQDADAIYREEIANAGLDRSIGQYFAALTNMRSVGVMGDERTYDYAIALRAVNTIDFMTAEAAEIPYEVLNKVMSRIINEVRGVNRVMYDITSKPPGTIEFE